MPSRSRAMSRIGRFLAACEISMSDFGIVMLRGRHMCDDPIKRTSGRERAYAEQGRQTSRKPRFDGDVGGFGPFGGVDLLAVGGLHAGDLEAAVGADDREAVASTATISPILPAMPLGSFAGSGLASKIFRSRRRASTRRRAPDCSRGSGDRSPATAGPNRCGHCRGRSGLHRSPSLSSCLMRGALPALTRSTASSIASTPIGNSRSK